MADTKETMIDWLRDAHAMEMATIDNQERLVGHLEHYPQLREHFRQSLQTSKVRADRLEGHLKTLGGSTSTLKEMTTRFVGQAQAAITGMAPDEVVKHLVAAAAFEEFEAANFRALATASEMQGDLTMKADFERMAIEEEEEVTWLRSQIPEVTRTYLARRAGDLGSAKS